MPLSKKVKNLLLRTCEKYGVDPDLIDTAQIDPSLTYDEVKPVIEEMISLLSPEHLPVSIREARRKEKEMFELMKEEMTAALNEAIVLYRDHRRERGIKSKLKRLKLFAEYVRADGKVLAKEEMRIEREFGSGRTINYHKILSYLEKIRGYIERVAEDFKEYPCMLSFIKKAENEIMRGINFAKLKIEGKPPPIIPTQLYYVNREKYERLIATRPHGLSGVSEVLLRAGRLLRNACKKGELGDLCRRID